MLPSHRKVLRRMLGIEFKPEVKLTPQLVAIIDQGEAYLKANRSQPNYFDYQLALWLATYRGKKTFEEEEAVPLEGEETRE